jgi:hypothetical protein
MIEKAYAHHVGGYDRLNQGSNAETPMEILTGRPAACIELDKYSAAQIVSDVGAGKLVVLETKPKFEDGNASSLVKSHAYDVTGTEMRDGRLYVVLYNPWGFRQPLPIPYDELERWFSRVDVGSVK